MIPQSSRRLIQSLQGPTALGGGIEIEVLQTHMSWLLLAGSCAYKIKKPVDLGFADFSTLEKRHRFCEEELRVNRRLAPEMYLGVVPICGTTEAPRLGGPGEPIEYAVKMTRFPQHARLDRVLGRNELTREHLDGLVRQIAEFHNRVEVDRHDEGFGVPDAVYRPMAANFNDLLRTDATEDRTKTHLRRLRDWNEHEFQRRRQDFADRKRNGFVRECHGDMHLANMVLQNGSVAVFDAIEFNESLRWIDVQNDLAFLIMDLEDNGRMDCSRRALNAYLEITGDYVGLSVVPYYLAYRALVRAKVAGIRLQQKGVQRDESERLHEELESYLKLADGYTSMPSPQMLITHGVSASGKTTGTQELVEATGGVRIRSDVERKRIFDLKPHARTGSDLNAGLYSADATRRCYGRLAELAEIVIRAGYTVIVDAACLEREQRDVLARVAARLSVPFSILDFHAPEQTLRQRITQRQTSDTDVSDADLSVLRAQLDSRDPLTAQERQAAIRVNSDNADWKNALVSTVQAW